MFSGQVVVSIILTLCMLGNFACFLSYAEFFFQNIFLRKIISGMYIIRVSNSLDTDQVRRFVGPDLCPNCLQRFSADGISRQIVEPLPCYILLFTTLFPNLYPQWEGGTLIFSSYAGLDPASTDYQKKKSGLSSTPKQYLIFLQSKKISSFCTLRNDLKRHRNDP